MKKLFKEARLATMMVMLFSFIALISCSDDDEDNPASLIVGTWSSNTYYSGTDYYTFNSDGSFSWRCPQYPTKHGYYTFENGLLILGATEGWSSSSYLVHFPNMDTLLLTGKDGDTYTYKRE